MASRTRRILAATATPVLLTAGIALAHQGGGSSDEGQPGAGFGPPQESQGRFGSRALGDHDRLAQVLSNLVENAIRVTPAGGTVAIAAGPGRLTVADTGPGIPAEDLPHAFERFHLHRRHSRGAPDGSGLGLAIVRELTEAMGGSVAVRSEPGRGAEFTVILPTA